ncbi:MAG TPA: DUF4097 family beta strand repeat-containing protein [Vicinamibacterales bacterium]|nr:DUF4097 family beta strand repeat-containing protein [Vicinamibacterales bacterium]
MGKRELVLIVAFIFLGTLLYQATAPPGPEGGGFSLRGMVDHIRREVGPRREYLADERTQKLPVDAALSEVRVEGVFSLRIEGTDGTDASARVQVYSTGVDESEARALGQKTTMKIARTGDMMQLAFAYPREGRQRALVTLSVPRRLRVRASGVRAELDVRGVAALEFDNTRGAVSVSSILGLVRGTHVGGEVSIENVKEVHLTARSSETTLSKVSGNVRLDLTAGALNARDLAGEVDIDANRADIELDRIGGLLRADLSQGSFEMNALSHETRVDARGTEVRISLAKPAPITARTTDENIEVRLPEQNGFALDISVDDGEIRLPEGAPQPSGDDRARHAVGPLHGGGPQLVLRTTHADVIVR